VARPALAVVSGGLALGVVGALGMTRFISSQLFGITATDPFTFAAVALLLGGVAAAACLLPIRRALAADPLAALKGE
jgi:ABC-type antimicrobial peptide transport system permease subunit